MTLVQSKNVRRESIVALLKRLNVDHGLIVALLKLDNPTNVKINLDLEGNFKVKIVRILVNWGGEYFDTNK